jgi:flagellar hook-associated protein 3 FlgL
MRISTQAASQSALMDLMRAQREAFDAREQLSTGRKAPDLKGYGNSAEAIISARSAQVRVDNYVSANTRLGNRLEVQDLAYRELSDSVSELRETLTTSDGTFLMNKVQESFDRAVIALNTRFNGSHVFAGVRTDAQPMTVSTIGQLQALADPMDAFNNASRRQSTQIDDNLAVDVNATASEVAGDLMGVFRRLADFNDGPDGPFNGPMTAAQQAFIQTEIANVIAAFERVNEAMGENGARQARVEASIRGHEARADYLTRMLADLEDADMAQAATRLTQAQTAVEVSAATFSILNQASLLPFLR